MAGFETQVLLTGATFAVGGEATASRFASTSKPSLQGTNAFRYMSQGELTAIKETGLLRGGRTGETFFTKDLFKSATKAQDRLSLFSSPTHRMEFQFLNNPSLELNGVRVAPDLKIGTSGMGNEFMTTQPVRVRIINVQPLRP